MNLRLHSGSWIDLSLIYLCFNMNKEKFQSDEVMSSEQVWENSVETIKEIFFRITEPSPEILEDELRLKIRFFNSTVFFFFI